MDGWGARLSADERGRDVLQLQHGERGQLLVDALEHVVVQVPGLVQLGLLAAGAVFLAPLVRLRQLAPVRLRAATTYKQAATGSKVQALRLARYFWHHSYASARSRPYACARHLHVRQPKQAACASSVL